MQRNIILASLVLLSGTYGHSQNASADYNNPFVQNGQRRTTDKFLQFLETGQVDSALKLISPTYLKSRKKYKSSLASYHKELLKYLDTTILSVVIVYPETRYNTYRCRYYNTKGEYFYIDLYFSVGRPNSLIEKILKKPENELTDERIALAKSLKEGEKTEPLPPPPFPPPGVNLKPVKKNK